MTQQDTEAGRPLDEEFDTQKDVEENPCGAWITIQSLVAERDALREAIEAADRVAAWAKEIEGRTASLTSGRRIVLERDIVGLLTALDDYRAALTGEAKP